MESRESTSSASRIAPAWMRALGLGWFVSRVLGSSLVSCLFLGVYLLVLSMGFVGVSLWEDMANSPQVTYNAPDLGYQQSSESTYQDNDTIYIIAVPMWIITLLVLILILALIAGAALIVSTIALLLMTLLIFAPMLFVVGRRLQGHTWKGVAMGLLLSTVFGIALGVAAYALAPLAIPNVHRFGGSLAVVGCLGAAMLGFALLLLLETFTWALQTIVRRVRDWWHREPADVLAVPG